MGGVCYHAINSSVPAEAVPGARCLISVMAFRSAHIRSRYSMHTVGGLPRLSAGRLAASGQRLEADGLLRLHLRPL
jgi:hypothetical protein